MNPLLKSLLKTALILVSTTLISISGTALPGRADEPQTRPDETPEKSGKSAKSVSPEDQQATMNFVREHHPELANLLDQLQKSRPEEFRAAIRQLVPQTQSILRVRDRAPARYPAQLAIWKRDSEIRLLVARWARNPDPELESRIKELIHERQQARKMDLEIEQKRLQEQLQKINEQLQAFAADPPSRVDTEWQQLSKQAASAFRSTKSSKIDKNSARPQSKTIPSEPTK